MLGSKRRAKGIPKGSLVWRTGLSGVPPDSVRCTRGLRAELLSLGNFQSRRAIIHRTVRCSKRTRPQELASLGKLLRYNSPDCPVNQQNNDYFSANDYLQRIKCAPARAEARHAHTGAPDTLQYMSGAPPDIQAGPEDRAPMVGTQRLW